MMNDKSEHNLCILARCVTDIEAELIVNLLEENGIESFVDTNIPHSILPVSADALVMVRETDYNQAKQIVEENIKNNQEEDIENEHTNNTLEDKGDASCQE